ncbi:hypothetical protein B0H14DRAFT_3466357 [Mycena olivaceomarginata]|nr:hypothetical protein B0H14DRAFT_3466357 [Mycena olivaceomarginata]
MAFDYLTVAESQMYRPQDALPLVFGIFPCLRALNMFVQYDCNSGPVSSLRPASRELYAHLARILSSSEALESIELHWLDSESKAGYMMPGQEELEAVLIPTLFNQHRALFISLHNSFTALLHLPIRIFNLEQRPSRVSLLVTGHHSSPCFHYMDEDPSLEPVFSTESTGGDHGPLPDQFVVQALLIA